MLWKRLMNIIEALTAQAEAGDSDAQFHLAENYYHGEGIEKDLEKALFWYQKSAEQNNATAQFFLAFMYYEGRGVSKDLNHAKGLWEKSYANGFELAGEFLKD